MLAWFEQSLLAVDIDQPEIPQNCANLAGSSLGYRLSPCHPGL